MPRKITFIESFKDTERQDAWYAASEKLANLHETLSKVITDALELSKLSRKYDFGIEGLLNSYFIPGMSAFRNGRHQSGNLIKMQKILDGYNEDNMEDEKDYLEY